MAGTLVSYGDLGNWLENNFDDNAWNPNNDIPEGVLSANVTTYKSGWFETQEQEKILDEFDIQSDDNYIVDKLNNFYRAKSNYVYTTELDNMISANDPDSRIYNGGIIDEFVMFNHWNEQNVPAEWLKVSEITAYSPNGQPVEEKNALGIYSAVKYGYSHLLPVMVAQNAEYSSVFFNDFENSDDVETEFSHSGKASFRYNADPDYEFMNDNTGITMNNHLLNSGAKVLVWIKSERDGDATFENSGANFKVNINNNLQAPFVKISKTGDWGLYEAQITDWGTTISNGDPIALKLMYNLESNEKLYVDDLRFQPLNANAVCSVYDTENFKLLAQFDDQHFGMFYQYNDEGKLVRKLVETERGVKTIQETQYNTPLVNRDK